MNKGRRPLRKVVVTAKAATGVTVTPAAARMKVLRSRKSRTLSIGVTVAPGTSAPTLVIVAGAKGVRATKGSLALKTVPAPPPPTPPAPPTNGISGRYFFNSTLIVGTTYVEGYYFVDDKFVYRGIPEGGLPSCTAQTAQGDGDGCLPYTSDQATGALNVAGVGGEFKLDSHVLKVGEESYSETVPAAAGTKVDATGEYINSYGICPNCTFVAVGIELTAAGASPDRRQSPAAPRNRNSPPCRPTSTAPTTSTRAATSSSPTPTATSSPTPSPSCSTSPTTLTPTTGFCSRTRFSSVPTPMSAAASPGRPAFLLRVTRHIKQALEILVRSRRRWYDGALVVKQRNRPWSEGMY